MTQPQVMNLLWVLSVDREDLTVGELADVLSVGQKKAVDAVLKFLHEQFILSRSPGTGRYGDRYKAAHGYLAHVLLESKEPRAQAAFSARRRLQLWADESELRDQRISSFGGLGRRIRLILNVVRPSIPSWHILRIRRYASSGRDKRLVRQSLVATTIGALLVILPALTYWRSFRGWPVSHWYRSPFLDLSVAADGRDTCLHRAAAENNVAAIRFLCGRDVDLEARDRTGDTPLYVAATSYGGSLEAVSALLDIGADPNAANDYGYTPMQAAAYLGQPGIAALLVAEGADIEAEDFEGLTPLLKAARSNRVGSVGSMNILLECGADVAHKDLLGWTALHHAVVAQDASKVRILLASNADKNVPDHAGRTPADLLEILPKTPSLRQSGEKIRALLE